MKANCSQPVVWFLLITAAGLCVLGCRPPGNAPAAKPTLRVLCGSSMAAPIQEIGRQFSARHGLALEYDLGGSETLLPKLLAGVPADVYVCHDPFEDKVKEAKRWGGSVVVGYLEPIVAVRPGNPQGIRALDDLKRPGLKLGMGDPRYSTCGALFVEALERRGLRDLVMPQVTLQGRTHAEIANGLILGPLDAVVVWNFVAVLYQGKLEVVPTDVTYPEARVTVVGLTQSANAAARDAFLQWCAQPEAQQTFRTVGYTKGTGPSAETKRPEPQVIAYYFHGTIRCEACLKIEKQAREAIERRFMVEMAEKRLVFQPVNYDKPENAHFLKDYKLPCPSLVVVRQKGGKDEKWTLLDKTWDHVEDLFKFNAYVEGAVEKVLDEGKPR